MAHAPDFQQRLGSIEELIHRIDSAADPSLKATAQELVQLVMDLHANGLERMLELIHSSGPEGESIIRKLGQDHLAASLLLLHGLHPLDMEARVASALETVTARLHSHGAVVELVSVQGSAVRLRLRTTGRGCGSTGQALKNMIEEAVYQAAPDMTALTIEGGEQDQSFVPLEVLRSNSPSPAVLHGLSPAAAGKGGL